MLPRLEHLPVFLNLLARSGTGQKLTTYTHLIHGPSEGQQLYVILLDNGRTRVLEDPAAWKALACIRCGACLNVCPVYRRVGGWAYGWVYPGPIGSILTPHLIGLAKAGELPFASSLCGACGEVCPVKIDIPHQLVHLRHRAVNEPSPMRSASERLMWTLWAWAMGGPLHYKLTMWAVRLGVRFRLFALASRQAWGLDPRPRLAAALRPGVPKLVEEEETMNRKFVGWAERSEPHHNAAGLFMVGLAPLDPIGTKLSHVMPEPAAYRHDSTHGRGTLIFANLR